MKIEKGMTIKVRGQLYNGYVVVTGERNGGGPTADFVGITEFGEEFMFGIHNIVE